MAFYNQHLGMFAPRPDSKPLEVVQRLGRETMSIQGGRDLGFYSFAKSQLRSLGLMKNDPHPTLRRYGMDVAGRFMQLHLRVPPKQAAENSAKAMQCWQTLRQVLENQDMTITDRQLLLHTIQAQTKGPKNIVDETGRTRSMVDPRAAEWDFLQRKLSALYAQGKSLKSMELDDKERILIYEKLEEYKEQEKQRELLNRLKRQWFVKLPWEVGKELKMAGAEEHIQVEPQDVRAQFWGPEVAEEERPPVGEIVTNPDRYRQLTKLFMEHELDKRFEGRLSFSVQSLDELSVEDANVLKRFHAKPHEQRICRKIIDMNQPEKKQKKKTAQLPMIQPPRRRDQGLVAGPLVRDPVDRLVLEASIIPNYIELLTAHTFALGFVDGMTELKVPLLGYKKSLETVLKSQAIVDLIQLMLRALNHFTGSDMKSFSLTPEFVESLDVSFYDQLAKILRKHEKGQLLLKQLKIDIALVEPVAGLEPSTSPSGAAVEVGDEGTVAGVPIGIVGMEGRILPFVELFTKCRLFMTYICAEGGVSASVFRLVKFFDRARPEVEDLVTLLRSTKDVCSHFVFWLTGSSGDLSCINALSYVKNQLEDF
ncbi:hypothetical protein GNI_084370 [Gregarina niphandrodes]|uniref:Uncharacterized protein n=1 Tax=Gregarina niphandrodes TaxID=110365 RepID=A0A023B616_GRENI|nr:hypothetical protein GNI_084370 [Gregarina niphandrodes]EZG65029.1 hypothetical protein GNI_084370 [Gregarina niphandrodes]|eukprot:XP_011134105.1 hypothetical protein GNI_084370 [Gregarina niphandrodes]